MDMVVLRNGQSCGIDMIACPGDFQRHYRWNITKCFTGPWDGADSLLEMAH